MRVLCHVSCGKIERPRSVHGAFDSLALPSFAASQMGQSLSANSTEVELNSSDLTRQPPLAGLDGRNATAPEGGRAEKPRIVLGDMYRRDGAHARRRGADSLAEFEADVEILNRRLANASSGFDWSPQVLTAINVAVLLMIVGGVIGGAAAFLASREAPQAPTQQHERMTESLFLQQSFERRSPPEDEAPAFVERRGGNDACC
ncbi:unnamed protein product [Prorocentrum cordatum]|uniref:Uncharacterized protein n=1 Tax=Prorocentrum cordatum TaxID=2364126 RepID=A0ABN9XL64_9DINO|nr:unnamed protein product [Polarella glacialis]